MPHPFESPLVHSNSHRLGIHLNVQVLVGHDPGPENTTDLLKAPVVERVQFLEIGVSLKRYFDNYKCAVPVAKKLQQC